MEATATRATAKYLTFSLAKEEYGIQILKVREIIAMMDITSVPQTPRFVKGVINLRGKVIPVIDLRLKFGLPEKEQDRETCIVIVDIEDRQMGIVIDAVREVLDIEVAQIEETPSFGVKLDTGFIEGIGKVKEEDKRNVEKKEYIVILLNIDRVLTSEELVSLGSI